MDRRRLVIGAVAALGACRVVRPVFAQSAGKTYRIGILDYGSEAARTGWWKALDARLRELGYVEGKNLQVESRFAGSSMERLPALADELVARKVDAIVTAGSAAAAAAKRATTTIPIVTTTGPDPVRLGLAKSFARPGGNVTGLTSITTDLSGKRLELIKSLLPKASRVGVVFDQQSRASQLGATETEAAATPLEITILKRGTRDVADVEAAFKEMRDARADVLILVASAAFFSHRSRLAESAVKHGLPTITGGQEYVEAGFLLGYGPDYPDLFRRAADYVDRIFKGAKPGDLPIERPSKFELVINLKTAKSLGITIPSDLAFRADHLIQ
jgi:putative tryptophan/tyrosine transport system substrate-binding protein